MPLVLERPKRPQHLEGTDAPELMPLEQARENLVRASEQARLQQVPHPRTVPSLR